MSPACNLRPAADDRKLHLGCQRVRAWKDAHRILKRAADHPGEQLKRHVVHHDGDDDLVRAEASTQPSDNAADHAAADKSGEQEKQQREPAETFQQWGQRDRQNCAADQLTVAAQVEDPGAKRDCDANADQGERDGVDQDIAEAGPGAERVAQECAPGGERRLAGEQQKPAWHRNGRKHGDHQGADHAVPVIQ